MDKSIAANLMWLRKPQGCCDHPAPIHQNLGQASEDVDKIRVLPTPSSVRLLNDARNSLQLTDSFPGPPVEP